MFEILDSDLRSLEDFPLKWRWNDKSWNLLPSEDLRQIKPLTETRAKEFHEIHLQYLLFDGLHDKFFEKVETIQTETSDFLTVQNWLKDKANTKQDIIIVSWTKDLAVKTSSEIFCKYWDDFCYPSSDDVSISLINLAWMLFYSHSEYFVFGKMKEEFL